jgi:hydroxymethylbilane synthase
VVQHSEREPDRARPRSSPRTLRIATRGSDLALWQARHVEGLLRAAHPGLEVELVPVSTEGDRRVDVPLSVIGGKGVFATEVQAALLDGRADLAVHSGKDLPATTADELVLAAVPERGDPRDALVGGRLDDLPDGAVVATGSSRRRAQLADLRPDLTFAELRGNMATRLAKSSAFDAIVVAAAAFRRLGMQEHLDEVLAVDRFVPQVSQGALAVECRADEPATLDLVSVIEDPGSRRTVDAERAFLAELGGDCDLPAGAHAVLGPDGSILLHGVLAAEVAGPLVRVTEVGPDPVALGSAVARAVRHRLDRT